MRSKLTILNFPSACVIHGGRRIRKTLDTELFDAKIRIKKFDVLCLLLCGWDVLFQ